MNETKKEPTTAELFATTRDGIHGRILDITADEAVSELERRMGAQDAALRAVRADVDACPCTSHDADAVCKRCEYLAEVVDAALTDAPPVFTLEEAEAAISAATVPSHLDVSAELKRCIRQNLATLRSTGGGR